MRQRGRDETNTVEQGPRGNALEETVMTLTKLAAGVGMIALLTTPAFAGPVEMTDDGLAQVVGGETDFSGGVI